MSASADGYAARMAREVSPNPQGGPIVQSLHLLREEYTPGVVGAAQAATAGVRGRESNQTRRVPSDTGELAQLVAEDVRRHVRVKDMAKKYRSDLVRLRSVRPETEVGLGRAFQRFLKDHVYGTLVPYDELSPAVQRGLLGGRPKQPRQR